MKKINYLLFLLILLLIIFIPKSGVAASNPYKNSQTIDGLTTVPCTYVAWREAYDRMGVALPMWGNAVNWYNNAKNAGYLVGSEAKVNSIAVYSGGCCGHVSYVIEVNEDEMTVIQGGYSSYKYDENGYPVLDENGNYIYVAYNGDGICYDCIYSTKVGSTAANRILVGYIYLDDAPKIPITNNSDNNSLTSNNSPTNKEEVKKSNNSYLKNITLSTGEIEFDKDILEYTIEVEYEIDKITIHGEVEDSKATVNGFDEYNLDVGENKITLIVTAEDETSREYKIIVNREENPIVPGKTLETDKKEVDNFNYYILLIGCVIILIIMFSGIIIFKRKNKKNAE